MEDLKEKLYQAVRHSNMAEVMNLLVLRGARASELEERTVRHAVKSIRRVLRFFRFIGR